MKVPVLHLPIDKDKCVISQKFWERKNTDFTNDIYRIFDGHHPGVDFSLPENSNIYACFNAVVVRNEWHSGMGNVVGLRNGNIVAIYGHLNKSLVKLGQIVKAGEKIGLSGNTGLATEENNPHLHFELRNIQKPTLKEMVFEPKFGEKIKEWAHELTYQINNKNTKKTLNFLSIRYFGNTLYAKKLQEINNLSNFKLNQVLPEGMEIIIPNFE